MSERQSQEKITRETAEYRNRLANCGSEQHDNLNVYTWVDFCDNAEYQDLISELRLFLSANENISEYLKLNVEERLHQFDLTVSDRTFSLQKEYIIEETALSLYFTEVREYNFELYVRTTHGLIDQLYKNFPNHVQGFLSKDRLARRFVSLEDDEKGVRTHVPVFSNMRFAWRRFAALCRRNARSIEVVIGLATLILILVEAVQVRTSINQIQHSIVLDQYRTVHEHKQRINTILLEANQKDLSQQVFKQDLDAILGFTLLNDYENLVKLRCDTAGFQDDHRLWGDVQKMVYNTLQSEYMANFWEENNQYFSDRMRYFVSKVLAKDGLIGKTQVDEICGM
jgi:hypothetical protein